MKLVFKIMPPAASFHGVDYNEKKQAQDVARRVHFQNFGYLQERTAISRQEFKEYFEKYSARNDRVRKKQFHAILSCKGASYSHEQLKDYALQIMQQMGYGDNPLLIYEHHDTRHNHVHIVTSRIAPDGSKIAHDMEGKKANALLTQLLQLDPKAALQQDLAEVLAYRASTLPQLLLLMELKGYTSKQEGAAYHFFKHGKEVGYTSLAALNNRIGEGEEHRKDQIKAIIHKYQGRYPTRLEREQEPFVRSSGQVQYGSDLTRYLQQKHGLQFYFFSKGGLPPYGYALIDHKTKTVYKGGDIMPLATLTQKADRRMKVLPLAPEPKVLGKSAKEWETISELLPLNNDSATRAEKQMPEASGLGEMFAAFDRFIDGVIAGNEMDSHVAGGYQRSSKDKEEQKRKSRQKGLGR